MKKLAGLVLVLTMILGIAVPSYAVNTDTTPNQTQHTITINGATDKDLGKFEAYQIFRGDITAGKLTNVTWGSGIQTGETAELLEALKADKTIGDEMTAALNSAQTDNIADVEAVAQTVASFENNSVKLDAFAEAAGKYLSSVKAVNGTNYSEITVTGDGYYLVQNADITEEGETYTKYILQTFGDVAITPKRDTVTLEKKIVEDKNRVTESNCSIGDAVTFELTSRVPAMDGYNKYFFIICDTLDEGLTFNDDVDIKIGNTKLLRDEVYTAGEEVQVSENHYAVNVNGQNVEIVFHDFLTHWKNHAGEAITVTYSATLNQNADLTEDGNKNTVHLEYSNNPNFDYEGDSDDSDKPGDDEPKGRTPDSVVTVYTTGIQLKKVDEEGEILTGAKFKIECANAKKVYQINKEIFVMDASADPAYYRLKDGTYTTQAPDNSTKSSYDGTDKYAKVNQVTEETKDLAVAKEGWVDENGIIAFTGLGAGTYTITELEAPEGYNRLNSPITVTVVWNGTEAAENGTGTADMWTVTFRTQKLTGGEQTVDSSFDSTGKFYTAEVVNRAGIEMPETGGIGTTWFYMMGSILLLGAAVLSVTRKRMDVKE